MLLDNLKTERLIFKLLNETHLPLIAEYFGYPEVIEFLFPVHDPEKDALEMLEKQQQRYAEDAFGLYALTEKESGVFVGMCGPLRQVVDGIPELEIGYHLMPGYWGRGLASEAAQACRNFIFQQDISRSIISIIHTENIRSQRVAERNGMVCEKTSRFFDFPVYIYRIQREKWEYLA